MRAISWVIRSSTFWSAAAMPAYLLSCSFLLRRITISALSVLMRCSYIPSSLLTSLAFSLSICASLAVSSWNSFIINSFSLSSTSSRDFSPAGPAVADDCIPSRVGASITSLAVTTIVSLPGDSFVTVIVNPSLSSLARYLATHTLADAANAAAVHALDVFAHSTTHAAANEPKPYVSADANVALFDAVGRSIATSSSLRHSACAQRAA
mmetsp:Transcript_14770/g.60314  ORF Transcript_14770/g.60314 Transcript_14770/m.60314 type:complete len:209 (-) Transcript_14770:620-1246(-)